MPRPFINDVWAPLGFKRDALPATSRPPTARSWVDDIDARRLAAYDLLGALRSNTAANYLPEPSEKTVREIVQADLIAGVAVNEPDYRDKIREYGDGYLLVVTGRALLLGENQSIELPDAADPPEDLPEVEKAAAAARATRAGVFQDWLEEWAEDEQLVATLFDAEENGVGDGDAVLVLGWDTETGRPSLDKYDPGFYFPDLTGRRGPWRNAVHVAWEEPGDRGRTMIRRQTWRLVDVEPWKPKYWAEGMPASTKRCVFSEALYDLSKLRDGQTVYTLPDSLAEWETVDGVEQRDVPQEWDFLPVVHVPNTPNGEGHYGRALPLLAAQLLEDLMQTDTDLQSGSAAAGSAPLITKGLGVANLPGGPGAHVALPGDGSATYLDTSRNLDALLKYETHLLDRLSVVTRLAAALLGRVKPNEVPSGYALELGFAATRSLIGEMRLVRRSKYPLILKFAMRIMQALGDGLPAGETPRAELVLGAFLPADKTAAAERVAKLLPTHGISTRSAVAELIEAGFAIDDAEEEVARILAEHGALAVAKVDATGDVNLALEQFGQAPTAPPAPAPVPPPAGP